MTMLLNWVMTPNRAPPEDLPHKHTQWVTSQDGIANLKQEEVDLVKPQEGEVLVKISVVSLNYRDVEVCSGTYGDQKSLKLAPPGPLVPCSDMCGTVVENRSSSKHLGPGTRVVSIFNQTHLTGQITEDDVASSLGWPLPGVLTQYRCFPAQSLIPVPSYLSDEEAACLPIASVTAWMAINSFRPLGQPLEVARRDRPRTVLIQGTGGEAIAGLQIAHALGLRTILTSSSDEQLTRAKKDLGADHTINHRTHWEWQEPVMEATDNRGADIIFEAGGTRTLRKSFQCVAFGGQISCIGNLSGKNEGDDDKQPELNRLNVNALALKRNVTLKGILNGPKDRFEEMLAFYEKKEIRPVVDKVFGFEDAVKGMEFVSKGDYFGKVVIKVVG